MSGYNIYRPLQGAYLTGPIAIFVWYRIKDLDVQRELAALPQSDRESALRALADLKQAAADAHERLRDNSGKGSPEAPAPIALPKPALERIPAWKAAEALEVSERRVTQLAVSGQLDGIKVRGKWMITAGSVEEYRVAKDIARLA